MRKVKITRTETIINIVETDLEPLELENGIKLIESIENNTNTNKNCNIKYNYNYF